MQIRFSNFVVIFGWIFLLVLFPQIALTLKIKTEAAFLPNLFVMSPLALLFSDLIEIGTGLRTRTEHLILIIIIEDNQNYFISHLFVLYRIHTQIWFDELHCYLFKVKSLKCVLIEFAIPNQSLIHISISKIL